MIKISKISVLILIASTLSTLHAELRDKIEYLELFDVKQYLSSKRYDAEIRKSKELVELSLWIDQSDDKRVLSSLMTRVPAKSLSSFEWINSSQNTELERIGTMKASGTFVNRDSLKRNEIKDFQSLFSAKKGYSSKLYYSDYANAEGLAIKLYVRVDNTQEPVNAPYQITAYSLNENGKAKFYMEATQACAFDGALLQEQSKVLLFNYRKSNSDGECVEQNKLELPI